MTDNNNIIIDDIQIEVIKKEEYKEFKSFGLSSRWKGKNHCSY